MVGFGKMFGWFARAAMGCAVVAMCPLTASAQGVDSPRNTIATPVAPISVAPASRPAPAPPSGPSFTGLYVGGLFGGAWGKADATTTTVFDTLGYFALSSVSAVNASGKHALRPNKMAFGGELGFNGQVGSAVIGAEGDFSRLTLADSLTTTALYPDFAPTTFTITQSVNTSWLVTLRGRAGAVVGGHLLVYGTAGLAMINLDYEASFSDTFANASEHGAINDKQKALVIGGGAEFHGGPHWSIKGEYLHADFGTLTTTSTNFSAFAPPPPPLLFPTTVFTHSTTFKLDLFRVGFNVGF